jgi:hypothetical protein
MLYWICPECGHECSPAIRECPTCTTPPVQQPVPEQTPLDRTPTNRTDPSQELLSFAQNFQSTPSASSSMAATSSATAVLIEEEEPKEPEIAHELESLDNLILKPARPGQSEAMKLPPAPVPGRLTSPVLARATAPNREELGLPPAGPTPAGEISFQAARGGNSVAIEQSVQPLPSLRQSVAFVHAELFRADRGGMAIADLAPVDAPPLKAVVPYRNGQPKDGMSTRLPYQPLPSKDKQPSFAPSRLKLTGASLVDLLNALKISSEEIDRVSIDAIAASFREQPPVALLCAPGEIVTAPAPPAEQWMRSQKPKFTAIAPENKGRAAAIAGPQAPPLAGPSLPPQLLNFQNSSLPRRRRQTANWLVSLLVATVVILGAVSLVQYLTQDRDTSAASAPPPAQITKAAPAPQMRVVEEHPAARSVEVAGVRVVTGPNKKPQLQYVVINHSSSELTGLNIRIAVRSVEALAGPPLFSVSSVVASLGPNQSKEIRTDLDSSVQPSAIPDWQSLRPEVLIARQ